MYNQNSDLMKQEKFMLPTMIESDFSAEELAEEIATELAPFSAEPVVVESLPAVLAAHTGIGVIAVCVAPLNPQPESILDSQPVP